MSDTQWADLARASRQALGLLGYPIDDRCLPDEPSPCGGTFQLHAIAHLATLAAVTDHHLEHLGGMDSPTAQDVYLHAADAIWCEAPP